MSDFVAGDKPILYEVVNNGLRYITTDKPDGTENSCAEYRRADLPPTLSAAMELPEVKVVILTMHKSGEFVSKALCAGVRGYVLKDNALEELIECIQLVSERKIYLSQDITGIVVDGFVNNNRENPESGESAVSPREREILQLLAEGKSNKDISDLLNLSIKTVETHRSNIMRKLGFRHITDLVLYAVRNHMIEL